MKLVNLPTIPPQALKAAQTEDATTEALTRLKNELQASLLECWSAGKESAQAFIDAYGVSAVKAFAVHRDLVTLFVTHAETLPEAARLDLSILSLILPYQANEDGTITVL